MSSNLPTRNLALNLLNEHVKEPYQILHAKMVANGLEAWAEALEQDKDLWYLTGLLHDLDYFEHPEEHPGISLQWFKEWNYPEELIHAVEAHAHGYREFTTEPQTLLASALMATDELSGFIYAYSLMRPEKLIGMEPKGVKKRLKDLRFAAKINREDINYGVEKFISFSNGVVDLDKHISLLIETFSKMEELK